VKQEAGHKLGPCRVSVQGISAGLHTRVVLQDVVEQRLNAAECPVLCIIESALSGSGVPQLELNGSWESGVVKLGGSYGTAVFLQMCLRSTGRLLQQPKIPGHYARCMLFAEQEPTLQHTSGHQALIDGLQAACEASLHPTGT